MFDVYRIVVVVVCIFICTWLIELLLFEHRIDIIIEQIITVEIIIIRWNHYRKELDECVIVDNYI